MAGLMAGAGAGPGPRAVLDQGDVARVRANLRRFDRNLGLGMRADGQAWGRALQQGLARAAKGAPAAQAHRFADGIDVDADMAGADVGATVVITADGAGFYNDSAVLSATEYGSSLKCFDSPQGGRYWVQPTVKAAEPLAVAAARRTTSMLVTRCNSGG